MVDRWREYESEHPVGAFSHKHITCNSAPFGSFSEVTLLATADTPVNQLLLTLSNYADVILRLLATSSDSNKSNRKGEQGAPIKRTHASTTKRARHTTWHTFSLVLIRHTLFFFVSLHRHSSDEEISEAEMTDRSNDQEDDDEGPGDEYDDEYFEDAKDRAELMAMPEVDREQILFERAKWIQKNTATRMYTGSSRPGVLTPNRLASTVTANTTVRSQTGCETFEEAGGDK